MKKKKKNVNAAILIIGNEILSGRTQDKNIAFISHWLNTKCGISVKEVRVIPDIEEIIIDTVNDCRQTYDHVFTTGGIGPTHDDITSIYKLRVICFIMITPSLDLAIYDANT